MAYSLAIIHPKDGRTFDHDWFIAYGKGDGSSVSGTLLDSAGNSIAGVVITSLPLSSSGYWALLVDKVPEGTDYALQVKDGTSTAKAAIPKVKYSFGISIDYPALGED